MGAKIRRGELFRKPLDIKKLKTVLRDLLADKH